MIECVSQGEFEHAFASVPADRSDRVLFTPNFAPRSEYEYGFARGVRVTLDNLYPLKMWPEVFRGREIFLRIDPGFGRGHHHHVRTAGSAFEIRRADRRGGRTRRLDAGCRRSRHRPACAHRQRNFRRRQLDRDRVRCSADLAQRFPDVKVVDLGGGIGVPEQIGHGEHRSAGAGCGRVAAEAAIPGHRFLDGARADSWSPKQAYWWRW